MTATLLFCVILAQVQPVQFSGTASMYSEYGWVTGDSLVQPRPELRFNVNPSLSLFGFPIGLDMLMSTQENPLRQQLDKFKLFLNPKKWLESQANLSGLALSLKGLELGSCNPSWTPYTLSGAPVFGGAVELNPWYVYAAAAAGRNQRRVAVSDSTEGAYARMLYSGRFGFGKKEGTHFYLTVLYAGDDTVPPANNWQPNPNDTTDTFEVVRPKENYVVGAEFNLSLAKDAFRLESEVTGSELTRDKRLPVEHWDWMPEWVANTFKPRMSSSVDYAFKVRPSLNVLDTRVYGKLEFVGPGYQSLGAPGLRNDNMAIGGGIERSFLDNAVSVSAAYTSEHDNLLAQAVEDSLGRVVRVLTMKSATTRFTNWEASLGLTFPNLPYLQVGYYPYTQATDNLDSMAQVASTSLTKGNVVSVSAGHSFETGKLSHSPGVSFSYNDVRSPASDSADNTSWDAGLNYGLGFEFPLSLSASCGLSRSVAVGMDPDQRVYFDVTPSYTLFEKWTNSLSLGGTFGSGTRIDTRLTSSFPIWKICDASLGVSDAIYNGNDGKYNDLRLTAQLSKSW
ncbi:MAG: hypothetical protein NTX53_06915 [candidate division WOR-3 bacterium]|nr:hypothetical protein [candidate division WOR-3 bacterium]